MPGRAEPSGGRAAAGPVAVPVPVTPGAAARPGGAGLRAKGFAITDLLGLEAELQPPPGPPPAATAGGYEGGGALGLGLGLLCSLGGPGAPCLLPAPLPLLPARGPRPPPGPPPAARRHKENISGERGRGRGWPLRRARGPPSGATAGAASHLRPRPASSRRCAIGSRAARPAGMPLLWPSGKCGLPPPAPGWHHRSGTAGSAVGGDPSVPRACSPREAGTVFGELRSVAPLSTGM